MIDMNEFILITSNPSNIKLTLERHEYHRLLVKKIYELLPDRYRNILLQDNIKNHDLDKISSNAYIYIYSMCDRCCNLFNNITTAVRRILLKAIENHTKQNTHHPEFWGSTEMDRNSVIEMICDWSAVQYEIYGDLKNLKKWYLDTGKKKFILNNNNEKLVLELITILQGRF